MKKKRLHPVGPTLLIRALEIEEIKSKGGIIIENGRNRIRNEELQSMGEVIELGPLAYHESTPWCKVGDIVYFHEHGARMVKRDISDEITPKHRMIEDRDVIALVEEYESNE